MLSFQKVIFSKFSLILFLTTAFVVHQYYYQDKFGTKDYQYHFLINASLISILIISVFYLISSLIKTKIIIFTNQTSFAKRETLEEYEMNAQIATDEEKTKLFNTPEFINMLAQKGDDESKWNWQIRDRLKDKLNTSDDDLSEIDVSRDE